MSVSKNNHKILLINPNWEKSRDTIWSKVASVYPPLGILNVAGVLEREGHIVDFIDMTAENIGVNDLKLNKKYDFIGITVTAPLVKSALAISEIIKKKYPNTKIILGGVHATHDHAILIKNPNIDIVVREEGEITTKEICEDKPLEDILGITYKDENSQIKINESRPQLDDLDWLPNIPYHLIKMHLYRPPLGGYKRLPAFMMITSRNCPNSCTYCQHYHYKVRARSAEKIFAEIKFLKENYGVKEINFYDDTLTIFRDNLIKLCNLMIDNNIDITWTCFTRANIVDKPLLEIMKKAGCHQVLFGVESSNKAILKAMKKNIKLEQVQKAVQLCREIGIETRTSYILGYPGETEVSMKRTLEFSKLIDSDYAQFNAITAYQGTKLYEEAKQKGWLIESDGLDMSNCNIETPLLKRDEVLKFYKTVHRKYYLRPKIILKKLSKIKSFEDIKQYIKGALATV